MKKTLISVLTVLLVLSLVVSSAFAFNLTYQKVSLPDPYGIMPLSLNEDSTDRTVFNSSPIVFGGYTSTRRTTLSSSSRSVTAGTAITDYLLGSLAATSSNTYTGGYFSIPSGTYIDVSASVAISSSDYGSILVTGGGTFYLVCSGVSTIPNLGRAYPNTAQFLVNGVPVGNYVACSNGSFTLPEMSIELTEDISSLGVRFTYTSGYSSSVSTGTFKSSIFLRSPFTDNINIAPVEKSATDYVPYFERVIAWLQSIFSALNPIQSTLESIESLLGSANDENSPISRLASVFARDDDIQLRDDVDPVLQEVTDVFFDTESNPTTAISVDKITTVGESIKGVDSMFQSGYDATDAFQDIADNQDDYLAWFSTDTAAWLDTVNTTSTVDDSDPFNMWRVQDQYNEIEERRGKD